MEGFRKLREGKHHEVEAFQLFNVVRIGSSMAMSRLHKPLQHVNTRGCWVDKNRLKGNSPLGWCRIQASTASAVESAKQ